MRPPVPGETDPFLGTRDELPNVGIRGTIASVDTRNGIVGVDIGVGIGHRPDVKIPMFQMSVLGANSSWFRFMPQVGDNVTLMQNTDGTIHVVNYECINYKQLADANDLNQFQFRELKQGEFEIRSAGLAEIFGSRNGVLRLAGGASSISFNRDSMEIDHDSVLHKFTSQSCEIRFGQVRRKLLPTDLEESALSNGIYKEHRIVISRDAGVVGLPMVDVKLGDVVDDITPFAPTIGSGGGPLRAHVRFYDTTGATVVVNLQLDAQGNIEITQSELATALGFKIVGLLSSFQAQFKEFIIQPTTTIKLGGTEASEPVPVGNVLNTFLQALVDALVSAVVATGTGPASFNPATVAALQNLKSTYLSSNQILSDVALTQKAPTPGSG